MSDADTECYRNSKERETTMDYGGQERPHMTCETWI